MTTSPNALPEPGAMVTVVVADINGKPHEFHGTFAGVRYAVTEAPDPALGTNTYRRYMVSGSHDLPLGEAPEPYLRVVSATGNPMPHNGLDRTGPDHWFTHSEIYLREGAAAVTISPITPVGVQWIADHQSLPNRRRGVIAKIEALDPSLASEVEDLFERIAQEARFDGQVLERSSSSDY